MLGVLALHYKIFFVFQHWNCLLSDEEGVDEEELVEEEEDEDDEEMSLNRVYDEHLEVSPSSLWSF